MTTKPAPTEPTRITTRRDPQAHARLMATLLPEYVKPAPAPAAKKAS